MKYKRLARSMGRKKRILVVSGPSGVGKGPLIENVKRIWEGYGWGKLKQVKVRKTKTERHTKKDESDFGFDREGDYIEINCRGVEQRLYTGEIDDAIKLGQNFPYERVIIEAYHTALAPLRERYSRYDEEVDLCSVFISPLDFSEIEKLAERLDDYLPDLMLDALVRRSQKEGKTFTRKLMGELEKRAVDSLDEIKDAHNYDWVIPNHCYECDSRWQMPASDDKPNLIGEPLEVAEALCMLLAYGKDSRAEQGSQYLVNFK